MSSYPSPTDAVLDGLRSPVDRVAARVIKNGVAWITSKHIQTNDSKNPILYDPVSPFSEVQEGKKIGSLVVLGRARGAKSSKKGASYVCRCLCGYYVTRRSKAIRNPLNDKDCCELCRQKAFLANKRHYKVFGRDLHDR